MLMRFNRQECNPVCIPYITNESERKGIKRSFDMTNDEALKKIPFRQAIGCLLYLASGTRPYLTFVVNKIRRKQSNYTWSDWFEISSFSLFGWNKKSQFKIYWTV